MKNNRGFTLIELLVVIAIIGILAGIILVAVNSARAKATNVKVISDVKQLRTQLEADYLSSSYVDLTNTGGVDGGFDINAPGTTTITQLLEDAANQGAGIHVVVAPPSGPVTAYAIYGQSTATSTEYFCMDSTGGTDQTVDSPTVPTSITCP